MRAGERVAVKVLVDNHWHLGRRCSPGEIIHLHEVQLRHLGNRVQRPPSAPVAQPAEVSPAKVEGPDTPDTRGDDDGGGEDPDPEPERHPDDPWFLPLKGNIKLGPHDIEGLD